MVLTFCQLLRVGYERGRAGVFLFSFERNQSSIFSGGGVHNVSRVKIFFFTTRLDY